ncbi:DUF7518 family protein [Haloparvum sedimenti]|uniref:DUF7518 family protein n=1 Tax=Haloparvum sedimenti TaxID=1678448 RepID=UPI00071E7F26|nr:hypothetical protein [Haloparvum sedimenti]
MSNRVEELEGQVAELQAAVNGLTEELVEMKERVRQLEDASEAREAREAAASTAPAEPAAAETDQPAAGPTAAESGPSEHTTKSDKRVEVVESTGEADADGAHGGAADPGAGDAEGGKAAEDADASEEGESEDGDIIVA